MAKALSAEKVALIKELYRKYGKYSTVAKEIGCAPSTVKKYVQQDMAESSENVEKEIIKFDCQIEEKIDYEKFGDPSTWFSIREEEKEDYENLRKEIV